MVKVPYCLRVTEERKIYEKLISGSAHWPIAPCAPHTLEMLARFAVLSRLKPHANSTAYSPRCGSMTARTSARPIPSVKTMQEYRDAAGVDEGMDGISTRFAYKVLSSHVQPLVQRGRGRPGASDVCAGAGDQAASLQFPEETEAAYLATIKSELASRYAEFIGNEIQKAYLESYGDYGQNLFDRYLDYADAWIEDQDFKDPDTGQMLNRELLNARVDQDRKAGGHRQPQGLPQRGGEIRAAYARVHQFRASNPSWTSYEKIREVIEKRMFSQVEDLLPVISFGSKKDNETEKKHNDFVSRMVVARLHRAAGSPAGGMVYAREAVGLSTPIGHHRS